MKEGHEPPTWLAVMRLDWVLVLSQSLLGSSKGQGECGGHRKLYAEAEMGQKLIPV